MWSDLQEGWVFQYKDRVRVGVGTCRAFQWWGLPPVSSRNRCVLPSMSRLGFSKNHFAKPVLHVILHINKKNHFIVRRMDWRLQECRAHVVPDSCK